MAEGDLYTVTYRGRRDAAPASFLKVEDHRFDLDQPAYDVPGELAQRLEADIDVLADIEKETKTARKERLAKGEEAERLAAEARDEARAAKDTARAQAAAGTGQSNPDAGLSYHDQVEEELRADLDARGLSTSGNKDELVRRLKDHDAGLLAPGQDAGESPEPEPEPETPETPTDEEQQGDDDNDNKEG